LSFSFEYAIYDKASRDVPILAVLFSLLNFMVLAMSAPTHAPVPSGQASHFLIATPTDHSPDIALVAATGIALILLTFAIRIYIRFNFSGPWLADDTVFALATVGNPRSELLGMELVIR
jgi:hypothetical protein